MSNDDERIIDEFRANGGTWGGDPPLVLVHHRGRRTGRELVSPMRSLPHESDTDVLYVIARNSATRQVVAVRKEERVRFPFAFRLSAGDAMMEGVPFAGPFDVTVRLSRSGDAVPQAGDLEGTVKNVAAGSRGLRVVVDTERR